MSKRKRNSKQKTRRIIVHGVRREMPDTRRLGRALLGLAAAQAEAEARAQVPPRPETDAGPEDGDD